jgi:hypothetical protein
MTRMRHRSLLDSLTSGPIGPPTRKARKRNHFARFAWPSWVMVALATVIVPAAPAAAAPYTILDLGTLGGTNSYAYGVNSSGQVVGEAYTPAMRPSMPSARSRTARSPPPAT